MRHLNRHRKVLYLNFRFPPKWRKGILLTVCNGFNGSWRTVSCRKGINGKKIMKVNGQRIEGIERKQNTTMSLMTVRYRLFLRESCKNCRRSCQNWRERSRWTGRMACRTSWIDCWRRWLKIGKRIDSFSNSRGTAQPHLNNLISFTHQCHFTRLMGHTIDLDLGIVLRIKNIDLKIWLNRLDRGGFKNQTGNRTVYWEIMQNLK